MAAEVKVFGHVGPAKSVDGADVPIRIGSEGQQLTSRMHGVHYEAARRGNIFIASTTPLGLAVPIYTATAPTVMLWNPSGSGKYGILIRYLIAYASATGITGPIGLSKIVNTGSSIATANVISAFAETTPTNGIINSGIKNQVRVSTAGTNTITAGIAADFFYTMFGQSALVSATAMNPYSTSHEFDGAVVIPPGVAIWTSATLATVSLLSQTIIWEEVDVI